MLRTRPVDLLARLPDVPDGELIRVFLADRSDLAFATLVARHGAMVHATCRRILGNCTDADDAFQAAFLVLARKASVVTLSESLSGWLHAVAVRCAMEVRRMRHRHHTEELTTEPVAEVARSPDLDLIATVDAELARLPDHYRIPVVLCELEGVSRAEAASRLGIPEGTLSSRLAKARKLLADRLRRRGIAASATTVMATLVGEVAARVRVELVRSVSDPIAQAGGTGLVSVTAIEAAQGVIKAMFVVKLRWSIVALGLVLGGIGGGSVLALGGSAASENGKPAAGSPNMVKPDRVAPRPSDLVKQLGDPDPRVRDAAEAALLALGDAAVPVVKQGRLNADPEISQRCEGLYPKLLLAVMIPPAFEGTDADRVALKQLADVGPNCRESRTRGLRYILERTPMVPDGDPPQKPVARRLEPHPKPILFLPAVVKLFDDTETVVALQDNTAHNMHIGTTEGRKRAAKMLDQFVEGMQIRDLALRLAVEITNQSVIEYGFIHVGPSRATSDALMEQYGISEAIYGFAFQVPEGMPIGGQAQRLIPAKGRLEVVKPAIPLTAAERRKAAFAKWEVWATNQPAAYRGPALPVESPKATPPAFKAP